MDPEKWPKFEILPIADRVISAALWVGRLFTKQVVHEVKPVQSDHWLPPDELAMPRTLKEIREERDATA